MKVLQSVRATAAGGRDGSAVTSDGAFAIRFILPRAAENAGGPGRTPEHLFAACFSACFLDAIKVSAARRNVRVASDSTVTAEVGIGKRRDGSGHGLDVGVVVNLPDIDPGLARDLVNEARSLCAYSSALENGGHMRVTVS